ncbi:MAG TPA: hypothetical protein VMH26_06140 [Burkholderiales bacterium]|nr:hypothetical protein [Burkholderiales bacterium]
MTTTGKFVAIEMAHAGFEIVEVLRLRKVRLALSHLPFPGPRLETIEQPPEPACGRRDAGCVSRPIRRGG